MVQVLTCGELLHVGGAGDIGSYIHGVLIFHRVPIIGLGKKFL